MNPSHETVAESRMALAGYNTNVVRRGRVLHVQSEDGGIRQGAVVTHVFADGGRVVMSQRTAYAVGVGALASGPWVAHLLRRQHRDVIVAILNGAVDEAPCGEAARYAALRPVAGIEGTTEPVALGDDALFAWLVERDDEPTR